MNAIYKTLSVPGQHKLLTPAQVKKPRRKKGEETPSSAKPGWPFKEMTINQRKVDLDPNAYKYVDYSKYDVAKTLVVKLAGDDDLRPYAFTQAELRLRRYQNSKPSASPIQVLFWFSDVQRTRLIQGEFRMQPHDACCVLRDVGLDNRIRGVELAYFSEKTPEDLDVELSAMALEERWIPDTEELARRKRMDDMYESERIEKDVAPRVARQGDELQTALASAHQKKIATNEELHEFVRSFDVDVRKLTKRFGGLGGTYRAYEEMLAQVDPSKAQGLYRTYYHFFGGLTRAGRDADGRLGGFEAIQKAIEDLIYNMRVTLGLPVKETPKPRDIKRIYLGDKVIQQETVDGKRIEYQIFPNSNGKLPPIP